MSQHMLVELAAIAEQPGELRRAALAAGGWCPTCSAEFTDPGRSPSRARHCRACWGRTPREV